MEDIIKVENGLVYVAFGRNFVNECLTSIKSVRKHNPALRVHVFTDMPRCFDGLQGVTTKLIHPEHARVKLNFLRKTPFERTLYLDTDTYVLVNLDEIFEMLTQFDILAVHDYARKRDRVSKIYPEYNQIPYAFPEVNGGVIGYTNSERTAKFLETWRLEYEALSGVFLWDQPSLRVALWKSEVQLAILPKEFNVRGRKHVRKAIKERKTNGGGFLRPRIVHFHLSNLMHKVPVPRLTSSLHRLVANLLRERLP